MEGPDFFISYTAVNQPWAEWIAVTLEQAGYTHAAAGLGLSSRAATSCTRCSRPPSSAARTIAVLSPAYFGSRFGEAEWRAAFAKDPTGAGCWSRCGCSRANRRGCWPAGSTSTWSTSTRPTARQRARRRGPGCASRHRPPFPGGSRDRGSRGGPHVEQSRATDADILRPR